MVEKLPLDFVRKIYNTLTNGNDDVNFYCMCIQNQNREAATNSPIKFALNLIKINILCRLPFSKRKLFSEEIGKAYLSGIFVRPAISELASGMLDNSRLITDIFGCAVTTIKKQDDIFIDIEKEIGVKGFAQLRKQYDNLKVPIQEIYKKISTKFKTVIDYKIELSAMEKHYVANKYAVRLLDVAVCNDVFVTAIVRSGYPREFIEKILRKYKISVDKLIITSEGETDFKNEALVNPEFTGVFSNDYNGFIKKFMKLNLKFEQDSELCDLENAVIISDNLPDSRNVENICNYLISEQNNEFIIFLNEQNRHVYFDGVHTEVFRHIRPLFIDISGKDGNKTSEVIYLYSTDEKILSAAEKFQQKKELKYTGVTLDIHSISRSDSEKIRMLEGVLDATEARLKEYIANKKQLDELLAKQEKRKHV